MNQKMGMTEFFGMEASEYLQHLDALVSSPRRPDTEELVRWTRALRGSALMANQEKIAAAASAFEIFCGAIHATRVQWDEASRQLAIRATDDLNVLVRAVANWGAQEDSLAAKIEGELNAAAGHRPAARQASAGLDTGARAFIGREGAAVAGALNRAATSLATNPDDEKPLEAIIKIMQPLLGIASLREAPPIPELLDAIDRVISEYARRSQRITNIWEIFEAAALALARAAREVAATGKPDPESQEALRFANLLGGALGSRASAVAVAIEDLYFDDAGPHVVRRGKSAAAVQLSTVDLVADGEYLAQAADQIDTAESVIQRELRGQAIQSKLLDFARARGSELATAFATFAGAAEGALGMGAATQSASLLAGSLRQAASVLRSAGQEAEGSLATRLNTLAAKLKKLAIRPVAAAAAPVSEESVGLASSIITYERYVAELGLSNPSLEELIAGTTAGLGSAAARTRTGITQPAPVRLSSPPPVAAGPSAPVRAPAAVAEPTADLPSIAEFCYSGVNALKEALALHDEVREAVSSTGREETAELIDRVFDLVKLGIKDK